MIGSEPMGESPAADAVQATNGGKMVPRETPQLEPQREALVKLWQDRVKKAKSHWGPAFTRMRRDMKFAAGYQWPDQDQEDQRYVANIVLRHIKHRTASLYGRNPRTVAKRRQQLLSTVWDGTLASLQNAQQTMQMVQQVAMNPAALAGAPPEQLGQLEASAMEAQAILQDAMQAAQQAKMLDRVAKTLELFYEYNLEEQVIPFKEGMKEVVRRALTAGVAYTKLGFQRAMQLKPEIERQIADYSERLATVERLAADLADGETQPDSAEAEQLRLTIASLRAEPQQIVREGLDLTYPDSTALIPDTACTRLRNWVGAKWVAEEYMLSSDDIQEVYGVDVSKSSTGYQRGQGGTAEDIRVHEPWSDREGSQLFCVWEIYSRKDGLVYVLCDGYSDFLREPAAPDVYIERFYPWFVLAFNEVYHHGTIFPPSDVTLIRDMQLEMNRARQGLREHRRANRPKIIVASGMLDDEDKSKLANHPANALIELNAVQPGQDVSALLQPMKMPPIDGTLYDTGAPFEDILRVVGSQEANLGGTSGASATETSIAEGSRVTGQSSDVDDLDEMLTAMARAAGQILLLNCQEPTVKEVVGPGAVWPQVDRATAAKEIYLEIEASSTGRPNRAAEVQNMTQVFPLLLQLPGLNPEWLARQMLTRLDERLDLSDAFAEGMASVAQMNRAQPTAAGPENDPNNQGGEGGDNSKTKPDRQNVQPQAPAPMAQTM